MEGIKEFPSSNVKLKTKLGDCSFVKMDIFQRKMWYSYPSSANKSIVELSLDYVNEVIEQNTKGVLPEKLEQFFNEIDEPKNDYENVVGQDSINRFDNRNKKKKKGNKRRFYKRKKKKI